MFEYLKQAFEEMWKGPFWAARWKTCLSLLQKPTEFFNGLGTKEWDNEAYLFGIASSMVYLVLSILKTGAILIMMTGFRGFVAFLITLIVMLAAWIVGMFLTYYFVAWVFGLAGKLILKKDLTDKVRPILFAVMACEIAGIVPFVGWLLALAGMIILMVIAYEKALQVERGAAVGSVILGMVFTGAAYAVVAIILLSLFALIGVSGMTLMGLQH